MGSIHIKSEVFRYSGNTWQQLGQVGFQQTLIDTQTGMTAQAQRIPQLTQKYIDSLELRAKHNNCLVDVFAVYKGNGTSSLVNSTIYCIDRNDDDGLTVLIEPINYRLPDLGSVKYSQALYILYQSLNGVKVISQEYKKTYIQFQQQMIGFNQQGECKIWLNTNYFKDIEYYGETQGRKEHQKNYTQIIMALIAAIQDRMSCELTTEQREEYEKAKQQYLKKTPYERSSEYIEEALELVKYLAYKNSISLTSFKMGIGEAIKTDRQPVKIMQSTLNKNNFLNLYKINDKGRISLKRKVSQEKREPFWSNLLNKHNIQLKKTSRQTTLNSSLVLTDFQQKCKVNQIIPNNGAKALNSYNGQQVFETPEAKKKNNEIKFSRTLFTRDSDYTSPIKNFGSPTKMGINVRRKVMN